MSRILFGAALAMALETVAHQNGQLRFFLILWLIVFGIVFRVIRKHGDSP